jgi:probable rRNA maturation factor
MTILVEVLDEAGAHISSHGVTGLVTAVLEAEQAEGAVSVVFVDEPVMAGLNRRYRDLNEPTDVLSFAEEPDEDHWFGRRPDESEADTGEPRSLGELVVCPAVVRRYAAEEGSEPGGQMAWTIVHGVLHLLGYDHEVDKGEMREREQVLLGSLSLLTSSLLAAENT